MSTNKYYALWHVLGNDRKSAAAISENPERLMPLHENTIANPYSCYHDYKDLIEEIKVEPIECYTYFPEIRVFEPYCDRDAAADNAFYAFNNLPTKDFDESGEILIYMSTAIHTEWIHKSDHYKNHVWSMIRGIRMNLDPEFPSFFYTDWPSHNPVEFDVYYEDGIINA